MPQLPTSVFAIVTKTFLLTQRIQIVYLCLLKRHWSASLSWNRVLSIQGGSLEKKTPLKRPKRQRTFTRVTVTSSSTLSFVFSQKISSVSITSPLNRRWACFSHSVAPNAWAFRLRWSRRSWGLSEMSLLPIHTISPSNFDSSLLEFVEMDCTNAIQHWNDVL